MLTDDITEPSSLPPSDEADEFVARDTDGPCTTECDCGDWSDEVNQETLPVVKQEPHDVCYAICLALL